MSSVKVLIAVGVVLVGTIGWCVWGYYDATQHTSYLLNECRQIERERDSLRVMLDWHKALRYPPRYEEDLEYEEIR